MATAFAIRIAACRSAAVLIASIASVIVIRPSVFGCRVSCGFRLVPIVEANDLTRSRCYVATAGGALPVAEIGSHYGRERPEDEYLLVHGHLLVSTCTVGDTFESASNTLQSQINVIFNPTFCFCGG
jgi:hypothetical protein